MQQLFAPHATDFYKPGHVKQYPPGTTEVYANMTPRSGRRAPAGTVDFDHIVWWGVQMWVIDHLINDWNDSFFSVRKDVALKKLSRRMTNSLGLGAVSMEQWSLLHDLDYLPLHIKSLPEGSLVPYRVAPMTLRSTHKDLAFLAMYIESAASAYLWKTCTSATTAYNFRKILNQYCLHTGASLEAAKFQIHDFSFRGLSGIYDGAVSATGHLLSSAGTDTILAIDSLERFYGADSDHELIGCSVPATEHSVMCMGGKEDELETIRRVIQDVYPVGIVSVVCDTWNYWDTITVILPKLKDVIMNRGKDALGFCKTVIRPDSGDPVRIICGYADAEVVRVSYAEERAFRVIETGELISEREFKGSIQLLGEIFGYTRNDAGYYDLNEHIGLIYGDSITLDKARDILERLMAKGYSANNVVLGVGSYSYQHVTRDTHGFAFKATSGIVNGERRELFKDPATDDGTKKSAAGLIRVMKDINGEYYQQDRCTEEEEQTGDLTDLFIDGSLCKFVTLADARKTLGVF